MSCAICGLDYGCNTIVVHSCTYELKKQLFDKEKQINELRESKLTRVELEKALWHIPWQEIGARKPLLRYLEVLEAIDDE